MIKEYVHEALVWLFCKEKYTLVAMLIFVKIAVLWVKYEQSLNLALFQVFTRIY